ncbi:MAG: hypothetical protein WKF43_10850 [Acidimicrobiales bacterium]
MPRPQPAESDEPDRPRREAVTTRRVDAKGDDQLPHRPLRGETVEISVGTKLIRSHKAKHDRTREHGALANPGGRPRRINAA